MSDPLDTRTPILTAAEAAHWLRLDEDHTEVSDAVKALHRLVRQGRLTPLRCGRSFKFTLIELNRFAIAETRASVCETDGKGSLDTDEAR